MQVNELVEKVEYWAISKGINNADSLYPQFGKMAEEFGEIAECLSKPHKKNELKGEIGDLIITAIILSQQAGFDFEKCLEIAFEKIKGRAGKTVDGVFVKDRK